MAMIGRLQSPTRFLFSASFSLLIASSVLAAETGHVLVVKDTISNAITIRQVPKAERKGGFYVLQTAGGATEKLDAMNVGTAVDLATFDPKSLDGRDEIASAKAVEANANAAIKKYPQLAAPLTPHLTDLRKQIARAEAGERKIGGTWMSAEKIAEITGTKKSTVSRGNLHLKNGTVYENVDIIAASPKEIKIVHASGAATIPLSLVPEEFIKKNLTPAHTGTKPAH